MAEGTPSPAARLLRGKRVLIVDDERDTLALVELVLREAGAEVVPAASAGAAMLCMQQNPFDLVVSDIGIPEMDGYTLAGKLCELAQAHGTRPRLVAFTGYSQAHDRQRALAAGFDAHIAKPVDPIALMTLVQRLLTLA